MERLFLRGATVQKVLIAGALVALRVRMPGSTWVVVLGPSGVGAVAPGPFRERWVSLGPPLASTLGLRRRLEGAKIEGAPGLGVDLTLGGEPFRLVAPASGPVLERRAPSLESPGDEPPAEGTGPREEDAAQRDAFLARGESLLRGFSESSLATKRVAVERALARGVVKGRRRRDAIAGDLARIDEVAQKAHDAAAFVAAASTAPRGARALTIVDWSTGEALEKSFPLDPAKSARENLDALFRRARRLKLARPGVAQRLADAEQLVAGLVALGPDAKAALDSADLDAVLASARKLAPQDVSLADAAPAGPGAGKKAPQQKARRPYRVFESAGDTTIFVGRGAADNDALTFHVGKPIDLWLHAKGRTGSHVLVPLPKGKSCPPEVLVDAAHLAAHFSDARGEAVVDVQYTPRRYLRKPKGSAPGFVVVDREKVLAVRVEAPRLAALLARERME